MWYNLPKEVLTVAEAFNKWNADNIGPVNFEECFGIKAYEVIVQTDAKVDDGSWQYTNEWNSPDWRGLEKPSYLVFRTFEELNIGTNQVYDHMEVSLLTYLGQDM